jgi:glycolate oxidase iron-sulfur subunit
VSGDCILCGKCLEVCPLLAATGREELGPRAKADLCALLAGDDSLLRGEDAARLAGLCLGCGRCRKVCSRGVDVPGLVAALRGAHPDFRGWLWKTWLTHARELWAAGSAAARLVPERWRPDKLGPLLKMLAGLKGGPGLDPFLTPTAFPDGHRGRKVLFFAGCTATHVQGRWLTSALALLDGLGVEVLPGDFGCCGGGLRAAGFAAEAGDMATRNFEVWRAAGRPGVVTLCASCLSGLAAAGRMLSGDEADAWADALTPLSTLVRSVSFRLSDDAPERVGYHRPCHADAGDSDYLLLREALGERLVAATDKECCGFGGVMRLVRPGLGDQVNGRCWERLGEAATVLTGCSACAAQLTATAPAGVRVGHWLEAVG